MEKNGVAFLTRPGVAMETLAQIDAELREFASSPANRGFLRRVFRVRLSGRKFRELAAGCLAPAARVR
jgi:hypothetical protein